MSNRKRHDSGSYAPIRYFQWFAKREDLITNNTLLLFSRLQQHSLFRFQRFLESILDEHTPQTIGASFEQQVRKTGGGSIPDGSISQSSFRILVETKRGKDFSVPQIQGHLGHFANEDIKIMLLLSPEQVSEQEFAMLLAEIHRAFTGDEHLSYQAIHFVPVTFRKVIEEMNAVLDEYRDYEMLDILHDYEEYCNGEGLLPASGFTMRAVIARYSHEDCMQYNIYYRLRDRKPSHHDYVGLYWDKCVRAIGKIECIVEADLEEDEVVRKDGSSVPLTSSQSNRIRESMRLGMQRGWGVDRGHRFHLVEQFIPTEFWKTSPGGLWGFKFFDLKTIVPELFAGTNTRVSTEAIAIALQGKKWE